MEKLIQIAMEAMENGADEQAIWSIIGDERMIPFIQPGDFGTVSVLVRVIDAAKENLNLA